MNNGFKKTMYRLRKLKKGSYYIFKGIFPEKHDHSVGSAFGMAAGVTASSMVSGTAFGLGYALITGTLTGALVAASAGIGAGVAASAYMGYQLVNNREQVASDFKRGRKVSKHASFEEYSMELLGPRDFIDRTKLETDTLQFYLRFGTNSPESEKKIKDIVKALSLDSLMDLYTLNRFAERSMHLNMKGVDQRKIDEMNMKYRPESYNWEELKSHHLKMEIGRKVEKVASEMNLCGKFLDELMGASKLDIIKMEQYLKKGLNPDLVHPNGKKLLELAIEAQNLPMAKLLVRYGANLVNKYQEYLPYVQTVPPAVKRELYQEYRNKTEMEQRLQKELSNLYNSSPNPDWNAVKILLQRGVNPDYKDENGNTLLHMAAKFGNNEVIDLLIQKKASIDIENNYGRTPLHASARMGEVETVKMLIHHGANVNYRDHEFQTPLFSAIFDPYQNAESPDINRLDTVKTLLERGALPNLMNIEGKTPLHQASHLFDIFSAKAPAIIELLLQKGANPIARDAQGKTPLEISNRPEGNTRLIEIYQGSLSVISRNYGERTADVIHSFSRLRQTERTTLLQPEH